MEVKLRPDIIVAWPKHCDYPLWRQFIHDNRDRFDKVIIIFTASDRDSDYRSFVILAMVEDNCFFADSPAYSPSRQDWRSVAVNHGLLYSNAEWVWFTEQDFLPKEGFFEEVEAAAEKYDSLVALSGDRMHPCCWFLKRETLNRTKKNFGILSGVCDHFGLLQKDLTNLQVPYYPLPESLYHHMNGLTHNYHMFEEDRAITYQPEEFYNYLKSCKMVTVPLSPHFVRRFSQNL